jgi:Ca2+-binding EF-hand superfamily protein
MRNPDTGDFFKAGDFKAGAQLTIAGHRFLFEAADTRTDALLEATRPFSRAEVAAIVATLKTKFRELSVTARRAFRMVDKDFSGFVTAEELEAAMKRWGVVVPRPELVAVFAALDPAGAGKLNFEQFCAAFADGAAPAAAAGAGAGARVPEEPVDPKLEAYGARLAAVELTEKQAAHLASIFTSFVRDFSGRSGESALREAFRRFDTNKDHQLSREEFRTIVATTLHLGPRDIGVLETRFFPEGVAKIDYEVFMKVFTAAVERHGHKAA